MSIITIITTIVIVILSSNHIKDLIGNSVVFPFISLLLTPLIVLHVFTVDVNLAAVVHLQIKRAFKIITFDLFDVKSSMTGKELYKPAFLLIGYKFISLFNNMGTVFWFMIAFIPFLLM